MTLLTMMMPSTAKRPVRPRELNLRRTSSCSSLLATDPYLPSQACQQGYEDKPEIITEDSEAEEREATRAQKEKGRQMCAVKCQEKDRDKRRHAVNCMDPIAAMQLINLKQKSRSFHLPPR